jgi:hypothetical protein
MKIFLVLWILLGSMGFAEVVDEGPYRFDLSVVNRWNVEIENVRVRVDVDVDRAMIKAGAKGYRATRMTVDLQEGQTEYEVTIKLREPRVRVEVMTTRGESIFTQIKSRGRQVSGDKYSFVITVLEMDYKYFTPWDVDIEIDNWPLWRADIDVDGLIFGRKITITFDRKELRRFSNDIVVKIPKDGQVRKNREKTQKMLLFSLQNKIENPHATREDIEKKLGELEGLKN